MASRSVLSQKEIEEEIMNEDLKQLGIQEDLANMDLQEKKNLLLAIKQSQESSYSPTINTPEKQKSSTLKDKSTPSNKTPGCILDFPDLPKTTLPSKPAPTMKNNLEDSKRPLFCLPNCDDDNDCPPLVLPRDCPIFSGLNQSEHTKIIYQEGTENNLLNEYESWREDYSKIMDMRKRLLDKNEEVLSDKNEVFSSPSSTRVEDDIYAFISEESSTIVPKVKPSRLDSSYNSLNKSLTKSIETINIDVEEDQQRLDDYDDFFVKSPNSQIDDEHPLSSLPNLRNKKKESSYVPEIEATDEKYNVDKGIWEPVQTIRKNTAIRGKRKNKSNSHFEKIMAQKDYTRRRVTCPICQKEFPEIEIESHAAECEGYCSDSAFDKSDERENERKREDVNQAGPSTGKRSGKGRNKRGN
uniref:UBZ4-type domain-containing protein n=1 Tax=Clastoptera arizonana TaxID=38151 RepID=A0A1B6CIS2_9HEMI